MAFVPDDRIGSLGAADLARFLAEPWNARIATVDDEGWPYVTPVWYEFDAATRTFEIVGRERAAWVAHIAREPRVALHIADDGHAQHTRVVVQGVAEAVEGPVAPAASARIGALTERLSLRYLGPSGPMYAARTAQRPRMLIRIRPTRWRSWTGQEWHPRYR
ncbi:MAG TPA: pyridoxamine 5'-phosphate oxidase family protein [Methylomirabilota bacterium]|jgi:PPOX class probable F420-dependent enzyme